jgi:hypothetical protein
VAQAIPTVGDLSIDDFKALVLGVVNESMATAKAAQDEAMKAQTAKAANTDAALSQLADALTQTAERIKAVEKNVTQFVGDLPRAQQRGYRPIGDSKAEITEKQAADVAPQEGGGRTWLYDFVAQGVTAQ